jgi:hypothetical protein
MFVEILESLQHSKRLIREMHQIQPRIDGDEKQI